MNRNTLRIYRCPVPACPHVGPWRAEDGYRCPEHRDATIGIHTTTTKERQE